MKRSRAASVPSLLPLLVLWSAAIIAAGDSTGLSHDQLLAFAGPDGSIHPVKTAADWQHRRAAILSSMQAIMGPLPGPERRCPLDVKVEEEVDCGSFVRRWLSYQAEPGSRVPAYLLIPKAALAPGVSREFPAVLTLHQTHSAGQKVVVGLGNSPDDEYGVELAKRGYVCLAPPYTMLANYQPDVKALAYASGTMLAIWNNIRGLDLLSSLPFVKTNGFGSIGHSLGGHNGVFTAAFDERIKIVVSSCGLDSFRDYYDGNPASWQPGRGWCQERYMPRLAGYRGRLEEIPFDFAEVLAAIAPRRVFISAPVGDSNFRWRSVDRLAASARDVFTLLDAPQNLRVEHPDGPHRFPPGMREIAYRLLDETLKN